MNIHENTSHEATITVNGMPVSLQDQSPIGRQVLNAAGLHPVDNYVLLQFLSDGALEEVSTDESVRVNEAGQTKFFALKTDRLFYFLLNDRKYPWEAEVPETLLRQLSGAPANVNIWLDRKDEADRQIALGEFVSLTGEGVERFYTTVSQAHHEPYLIIVNGRQRQVNEHELTYAEIIRLAFPDGPFTENTIYTVTYANPHGGAEGSMVEGDIVNVKKGMIFNVSKTDRS